MSPKPRCLTCFPAEFCEHNQAPFCESTWGTCLNRIPRQGEPRKPHKCKLKTNEHGKWHECGYCHDAPDSQSLTPQTTIPIPMIPPPQESQVFDPLAIARIR